MRKSRILKTAQKKMTNEYKNWCLGFGLNPEEKYSEDLEELSKYIQVMPYNGWILIDFN